MIIVKRIKAGQYSVSDGRYIIKDSSGWYIINTEGSHDLGPVPTLASAKEYVTQGAISLGKHKINSKHGQRQSKKEFNAYLASEAKNGNYAPLIISLIVMFVAAILFSTLQGR